MPRDVFSDLVGQDQVAGFLRGAVESDSVSHAYLFVGPPGTGKKSAALALACALLCGGTECDGCPGCSRVRHGGHPDVRVFEPEGAAGYVIEQIRDQVVHFAGFAPVEGPAQVFIIGRADTFNDASANAFLKTLEEPSPQTHFILLAHSYADVLPTITSRCQVVRFAPVTPARAVALLAEKTGAGPEDARAALAASGGVVPRALEFLRSPMRRAARERLLGVLQDLPTMDGQDVLVSARELLGQVKAPLEEVKERQSAEMAERQEFLGRTAGSLKPLEDRHKRELTAREREGLGELLSVAESWLRDALVAAEGADVEAANLDVTDEVAAMGACAGPPAILAALDAVRVARKRITYNVSPQLAIEAMLFDIQEALACPQ